MTKRIPRRRRGGSSSSGSRRLSLGGFRFGPLNICLGCRQPYQTGSLSYLFNPDFFPNFFLPFFFGLHSFRVLKSLCGRKRERETTYCDDEIFVFAFDASFIRDDDVYATTFFFITDDEFAPGFVGFSRRGTRKKSSSIRDEMREDTNDDKDDDGKRGINVNEDPNVYQFKKGTEEHVEVLTNENFKKFTTSGEHVLVTFYAPWDGHSKSFLKQFHELGTSHTISSDSRLKFGKVDATVEKELAKEFEVETYPQIILFRHGQPKEYKGSLVAESEGLRKWLRRNTHHKPAAWLEGVDDVHVFTLGRPVCIVGFFDDTGHLDNFHAAAYDFHLDFGERVRKSPRRSTRPNDQGSSCSKFRRAGAF